LPSGSLSGLTRRRRRRRRRKVYESLSRADAVNEEDPSATALPRCRRLVPPCYVPEGGGGGGGMFIPSKHSIPVNEEFAGRDHATQP